MPENFLKASGILVLAPGSGGPLTTTLPSARPAARTASQLALGGAAPPAGAAGAAVGPHALASPRARPPLTRATPLSSCRRVARMVTGYATVIRATRNALP